MPWRIGELPHTILGKIWILLQLIIFKDKMLFPRIILELRGVNSHYFGEDLDEITRAFYAIYKASSKLLDFWLKFP